MTDLLQEAQEVQAQMEHTARQELESCVRTQIAAVCYKLQLF